jgi:5-methylcytosine-specific restriction endonuclease McrA
MRHDYITRALLFSQGLGIPLEDLQKHLRRMYLDEQMSAQEIADLLESKTKQKITARSIQRYLKSAGVTRSVGDSFRLAMARNRVQFRYKDARYKARRPDLRSSGLRYTILKRDGFRCVLCGVTAETSLLEIDHIIPVVRGGGTDETNLRTLCHICNTGKRIAEKEL